MLTFTTVYLSDEKLDRYLACGWYRMGQHIFTTNQIFYGEEFYKVYWLRYNLTKFQFTAKHHKILDKVKNFDFEINNEILTDELKALYEKYYEQINFSASATLNDVLLSCESNPEITRVIYNTVALQAKHKNTIIAAGIMDLGKNTIAGILNFYHPEYKKYSLGKVMVLKKLQYAIEQNLDYYYPGYIVPGVNKFNYKTFVGEDCMEVWDTEKQEWITYKNFFNTNSVN